MFEKFKLAFGTLGIRPLTIYDRMRLLSTIDKHNGRAYLEDSSGACWPAKLGYPYVLRIGFRTYVALDSKIFCDRGHVDEIKLYTWKRFKFYATDIETLDASTTSVRLLIPFKEWSYATAY